MLQITCLNSYLLLYIPVDGSLIHKLWYPFLDEPGGTVPGKVMIHKHINVDFMSPWLRHIRRNQTSRIPWIVYELFFYIHNQKSTSFSHESLCNQICGGLILYFLHVVVGSGLASVIIQVLFISYQLPLSTLESQSVPGDIQLHSPWDIQSHPYMKNNHILEGYHTLPATFNRDFQDRSQMGHRHCTIVVRIYSSKFLTIHFSHIWQLCI